MYFNIYRMPLEENITEMVNAYCHVESRVAPISNRQSDSAHIFRGVYGGIDNPRDKVSLKSLTWGCKRDLPACRFAVEFPTLESCHH